MATKTGKVISNDGNILVIRNSNGATRTIRRLDKSPMGVGLALEYNNKPLTPEEFKSWFPVGLETE